jgi:hypothetical protein
MLINHCAQQDGFLMKNRLVEADSIIPGERQQTVNSGQPVKVDKPADTN